MITTKEAREKGRRGEAIDAAPSLLQALEARIDESLVQSMRDWAWPLNVFLSDEEMPIGNLVAYLYRELGWDAEVGSSPLLPPHAKFLVFKEPT